MADVDTGLGWYADQDWLSAVAGAIGSISTAGEQAYYVITYSAPIILATKSGTPYTLTVNNNQDTVYFGVQYYSGPTGMNIRVCCLSVSAFSADVTSWGTAQAQQNYGGSGDYYCTLQRITLSSGSWGYLYPDKVLPGETAEEAVTNMLSGLSIATETSYAKAGTGYSVTCICKWRTDYSGPVYVSPVLISSEPNNTLYTRNSATPSINNTEHQYQGKTFYMRKAPLDTFTDGAEITATFPVVDLSGVAQTNDTIFAAIAYQSGLTVGYIPSDKDPYAPGGNSGPGGGTDTDFDITGDTILDSPLPTFSFADSGFARIYNPDLSQLQRLANYLWTDTTFLQTIVNHAKQLLEDPIESIITLNRLPIAVPNGEAEVVKVLYIPTNTSMPPVTNQFVDVDCGTLQIKHEYDSALDYNPYTDISLVLPFIGVVQLDPDEVMDKTLSLTYRVDVVSGMCVAKVAVDGCVLYQYSGNCAISMPFNSADFSNYISAMVTAAKSIAGVAAAGAAGAMAAAAEGTNAVKAIVAKATSGEPESKGPSLPKPSNKSTNVIKETFGEGGLGEGTLKAAKKGVANTVSAVVSSKRTIEHAGHFSGNSGFLGVRRPYAIIKRPRMCNPNEYGRFNGRPCMMYLYLGNLSGYTEVQEIHLTGIVATNDELIEIENLLKSGVIL